MGTGDSYKGFSGFLMGMAADRPEGSTLERVMWLRGEALEGIERRGGAARSRNLRSLVDVAFGGSRLQRAADGVTLIAAETELTFWWSPPRGLTLAVAAYGVLKAHHVPVVATADEAEKHVQLQEGPLWKR